MYYHVRITQKSSRTRDEVKLDLTKDELFSQFVTPYETGNPFIVSGKTIPLDDLERIRVTETEKDSSEILPEVREERRKSGVLVLISDEWYVAEKGRDITDELIKGPPGYKASERKEEVKIESQPDTVFIVHGHDDALKNDLETFLTGIGLRPIILHKQPDEGMTIIEKLEKYSDVGYAFILLTPDDAGYPTKELKKEEKERIVEYRARQNVIFEFGYLLGKLGRNRVCCLYRKETSLPTDISGLLYKEVTSSIDDIGYAIIKEVKAAGYEPKL